MFYRSMMVDGKPHGEVWKARGKWHWFKEGRGIETYNRTARMLTVREHIARLNGHKLIHQVRLVRQPKPAAYHGGVRP